MLQLPTTVYKELVGILNNPNIVFNCRFIDDIFTIVDITDIENFDSWVKSNF